MTTNRTLEAALAAEIEHHDSALMTTPHLSRIRHAAAELLRLMRQPDSAEARGEAPGAPGKRGGVTFHLTTRGKEMLGRTRLGRREELSDGHGLKECEIGADLHTDDPAVVARVREFFGDEIVEEFGEKKPIYVLIDTIRSAIDTYDKSDDHCPHAGNSDCVRCNAAAAVYYPEHPKRQPPRRARKSA